jgi:tricorn protease
LPFKCNLHRYVVALPMPAGRYSCLTGLDDGRFMLVKTPVKNAGRVGLDAPYYADSDDENANSDDDDEGGGTGALLRFDVRKLKLACLIDEGVCSVQLSLDRRCMAVEIVDQGVNELRVYKAGVKPDDEDSDGEEVDWDNYDRRSGLIDVEGRIQVMVDPRKEWAQMLGEVWRCTLNQVDP